MSISLFKATCLAVLERVRKTGVRIVITRHGEPVAEVGPPRPETPPPSWLGDLRGHGRITGDVVGPVTEQNEWEVLGS